MPDRDRFVRCLTLATALWLAGAAAGQSADVSPVIAQRGAYSLTAGQVRDLIAGLDAEQQAKLRADPSALSSFVRDRVLQAALLDEARSKQFDQRPEIANRAEQARNAFIAEQYLTSLSQPDPAFPSEQDIQGAYEANKAKLLVPRQYHLSQIFVAVPGGSPKADDDDAQSRLTAMRPLWSKGKPDTGAAVAKSVDAKPSDGKRAAAVASDLGWVREDQVVAAIRPTIAGMAEGAIAEPIRMADGWHLVRLIETKPAAPASLAEVHDALARALRQTRQQQNARAYLDALLSRTPIQLNEIELGRLVGK